MVCVCVDGPVLAQPYYGGPKVFELALDVLEDACAGLLVELCGADLDDEGDVHEACDLVDNPVEQLECHNMRHQCC